jgi:rhodanese-related sulfurtransferase
MKLVSSLSVASALIFSFALSAHSATTADCSKDETYGDITKAELKTLVADDKVVLVDANSGKSFKKNKIGKAVHFDKKRDIAAVLPKDTSKDQLIVAYCGGPACAAWKDAAVKACEAGYTNVKHFSGGITGWAKN